MTTDTEPPTEPVLQIERVFAAPRERVWKAWTEAEHLTHWWGPKGLPLRVAALDAQPGGLFLYAITLPDGGTMWGKFTYRELAAPEGLVFVNSFSDAQAGVTRHPWSATWPLETLTTLTLAEQAGQTTLTLRGTPLNATETESQTFAEGRESMRQSFAGTLDQLAAYLA